MKHPFTCATIMYFLPSLISRVSSFIPSATRLQPRSFTTNVATSAFDKLVQSKNQKISSYASSSHTRFMSSIVSDEPDVIVELPTNENDETLLRLRHSSAHVMAMAVQQSFPEAQTTIGPWIDNGFYYDFFFPELKDAETGEITPSRKLNESDLKKVKKAFDKIVSKDYPITREEVSREEARKRIESIAEPFKLEILDAIKTEPITIYKIGEEWWDLCAGPHLESTGKIPKKAVQLQSVAGAYWRGDENNQMLQRIYATAWRNVQQLKQYKKMVQEAKKRDHRVLGKQLGLFSIQVCIFNSLSSHAIRNLCNSSISTIKYILGTNYYFMLPSPNYSPTKFLPFATSTGRCRWRTCFLASQGISNTSHYRRFLEICTYCARL